MWVATNESSPGATCRRLPSPRPVDLDGNEPLANARCSDLQVPAYGCGSVPDLHRLPLDVVRVWCHEIVIESHHGRRRAVNATPRRVTCGTKWQSARRGSSDVERLDVGLP